MHQSRRLAAQFVVCASALGALAEITPPHVKDVPEFGALVAAGILLAGLWLAQKAFLSAEPDGTVGAWGRHLNVAVLATEIVLGVASACLLLSGGFAGVCSLLLIASGTDVPTSLAGYSFALAVAGACGLLIATGGVQPVLTRRAAAVPST